MTPDVDKISPKNEGACQLEKPPFFQCCCTCLHHVRTRSRQDREALGWACDVWRTLPDDNGIINVDWPEHSCGCELWHDTRKGSTGDTTETSGDNDR